MISYLLGDTVTVEFSIVDGTPDATPAVNFYAGDSLLGAGAVSPLGGTNNYRATYALPASGIADGVPIKFRADAAVGGDSVATLQGVAGVVGATAVAADAVAAKVNTGLRR